MQDCLEEFSNFISKCTTLKHIVFQVLNLYNLNYFNIDLKKKKKLQKTNVELIKCIAHSASIKSVTLQGKSAGEKVDEVCDVLLGVQKLQRLTIVSSNYCE